MDTDCVLVRLNQHQIIVEPGPLSTPPEIIWEDTSISEHGDLPKGAYMYNVTAVGTNGESSAATDLLVNAYHNNNAVIIRWKPIPYVNEYRVYRSGKDGPDGYFTVFTYDGYFCDDGRGVPNRLAMTPPAVTQSVFYGSKCIHKDSIDSILTNNAGDVAEIFIKLKSGEVLAIDICKVINRPTWTKYKSHLGLAIAETELKVWLYGDIKE